MKNKLMLIPVLLFITGVLLIGAGVAARLMPQPSPIHHIPTPKRTASPTPEVTASPTPLPTIPPPTPPVEIPTATPEDARIEKVIVVTQMKGSEAIVNAYTITNGNRELMYTTTGYIGQNGVSFDRAAGDKTTPGGEYAFGIAFGVLSDPGDLRVAYRQVQKGDYWVGDSASKYYNQWRSLDDPDKDWKESQSEHLIDYGEAYHYAIEIRFNAQPDAVPGKGSAIFLHCLGTSRYTDGCIAVAKDDMLWLLRYIDDTAKIVIQAADGETEP